MRATPSFLYPRLHGKKANVVKVVKLVKLKMKSLSEL